MPSKSVLSVHTLGGEIPVCLAP